MMLLDMSARVSPVAEPPSRRCQAEASRASTCARVCNRSQSPPTGSCDVAASPGRYTRSGTSTNPGSAHRP